MAQHLQNEKVPAKNKNFMILKGGEKILEKGRFWISNK
jgi:hypothetical protein